MCLTYHIYQNVCPEFDYYNLYGVLHLNFSGGKAFSGRKPITLKENIHRDIQITFPKRTIKIVNTIQTPEGTTTQEAKIDNLGGLIHICELTNEILTIPQDNPLHLNILVLIRKKEIQLISDSFLIAEYCTVPSPQKLNIHITDSPILEPHTKRFERLLKLIQGAEK